MWIKICGNTSLGDARAAADLGADALGFIFTLSRREVTVEQVARIAPHLPDTVERIGVFTVAASEPPDDLERIAGAAIGANLTGVQLHGGVSLDFAQHLQGRLGPAFSVIQTAHWKLGENAASALRVETQLRENASVPAPFRVLVDAQAGSASGGLGVSFQWAQARAVLATQPGLRIIVAGGLRPDNVMQAIRDLRPYGVDVASGVEESPGKKDPRKLQAFMKAARGEVS